MGALRRERLTGHVLSILPQRPVVIEAPFGYGKSELLRAAADALRDTDVDVRTIEGGSAQTIDAALQAIWSSSDRSATTIVVDEADEQLDAILAQAAVARASGRDWRLLLATRPLPASRRAAIAAAAVLGPEDMVFRWDEFVEVARQSDAVRRGTLSPPEAFAETLGWPQAVQHLLAISARGGRRAVDGELDLSGVFLGAEERDLYFALGFLPRYDRSLITAVARYLGMSATIEDIRLRALPSTSDGGWTTIHPIVAAALRRDARTLSPLDPIELQSAASGWLADAGMPAEALALALDMGDRGKVFDLLATHGQTLVESGRIEPLVTVGERFGPEEIPDVVPIAPVVWALMFGGAVVHARGFLRGAERDGDRVRARTAALMTSCMDVYAGHIVRRGPSPVDEPTGDAYLDSIAVDLTTLADIDAGLFGEARERQAAFRAAAIGRDGLCPLTYGEVLVALAHLLEGRLEEARYHAAHAMGAAEAVHGVRAPAAGFAAAYLADALFQLGRWDEVTPLLAERLDVVEKVAFPDGAARAFVALARVSAADGRWDDAQTALDRLDLLVRRRGWSAVHPFLLAEQCRLALIRGNDAAATRVHERLSALVEAPLGRNRPCPRFWDAPTMRDLSAVRLAWVSGDRNRACWLKDKMLDGDVDWQVSAALSVYSTEADGDAAEHPLARFEQLLFHRRPRGARVSPQGPAGQDKAVLHNACRSLALTPREEEILGLLVSGLSYKHIAGVLGLSLDTVKWHLKRVYAKLDVDDRSSAVIKMATLADAARRPH